MKITKVEFSKKDSFDPVTITATFEDGTSKRLFDYFDDEISFDETELLGLTEDEAHDLFHRKDVEYLRS